MHAEGLNVPTLQWRATFKLATRILALVSKLTPLTLTTFHQTPLRLSLGLKAVSAHFSLISKLNWNVRHALG